MSKPYVSIIMGSYEPRNQAWIREAVESLIAQSWTDWELLICDDGSNEEGARILRWTATMDPRIRLFRSEKNMGLASALNLCLRHARGTLIARMDDDDYSEPERLETQVRYLESHPDVDWVGSCAWLFDDEGIWGKFDQPENPTPGDYLRFSPFIHPSVMFRREALIPGGYTESPLTLRCEDYELFMRLTAKGMKGANLPDRLLRYREKRVRIAKRKFRCCFSEMIVRYQGFARLNILFLKNLPYVLKPMLVWVVSVFPGAAQRLRIRRSAGVRAMNEKQK